MDINNINALLPFLSGPLLALIGGFLVVVFAVVILSIIRGMLNIFFTTLLIVSLLLTSEFIFAYYLSTEDYMAKNMSAIFKPGDSEKIMDILVDAVITMFMEKNPDITVTPKMREHIRQGLKNGDVNEIRMAVGIYLVNMAINSSKPQLASLGITDVSISDNGIDQIVKALVQDKPASEIREIIAQQTYKSIENQVAPSSRDKIREDLIAIYDTALPDTAIKTAKDLINSVDPEAITKLSATTKSRLGALETVASGDFHEKYSSENISLRSASGLNLIFALPSTMITSPLALPITAFKEEITPEQLHNMMKKALLLFVVVDLILVAALFVINLGFDGALSHLGMGMIISGVLVFLFSAAARKVTLLLTPDGELVTKITEHSSSLQVQVIIELMKIYSSRISDVIIHCLDIRKIGGIGYIVAGAIIYAQSKLHFLPVGKKKKK